MKKLLLVDAYSLIFRSYYAFIKNPRINSKGQNVSAVYGFVNTLNELIGKCTPSHIAVAFDMGHDTFRKQQFASYKSNREKTPEDIKNAVPHIVTILEAMHICCVQHPGFEADDVIGTLAKWGEQEDFEVYMATSDKDYIQLMGDKVFLYKPKHPSGFALLDKSSACQLYNINQPEQMIDLLGLQGDASDNIPGCKGIGEKRAIALLLQYGSIDNIFSHINELQESLKSKIESQYEMIRLSKQLATINTQVPLSIKLDDLRTTPYNYDKLVSIFQELEFNSLLKKMQYDKQPVVENNLFSQTSKITQEGIPARELPIEQRLVKYLLNPEIVNDSYSLNDLEKLKADVDLWKLYKDVELPLVPILKQMSHTGVRIDVNILKQEESKLQKELDIIEKDIFQQVGESFNVNSPKQVSYILFEKLNIGKEEKGRKTGHYSTSEEVLSNYKNKFPVVKKILEYREIKKLISTYLSNLPTYIDSHTGKIHTTFNQTSTATGRLSSSNPNLQNLPIRSERGKIIRKAVIADDGCQIVSADYSQVELRIMAHLSQDAHMLEAFSKNADIHSITATKIFNIPIELVTVEQRRIAKTANFGIIYGISSFGLSQQLECSRTYAQKLIDDYFIAFPSIRQFIDKQITYAKDFGFVKTLFGRKRYLPDIFSQNANVRKYAERNAINAPIQGSAADIIKKAMVEIDRQFNVRKLNAKMILQIHDELCFNVPNDEVEDVKELVKDIMQGVVALSVPLVVECNAGYNWLEAH